MFNFLSILGMAMGLGGTPANYQPQTGTIDPATWQPGRSDSSTLAVRGYSLMHAAHDAPWVKAMLDAYIARNPSAQDYIYRVGDKTYEEMLAKNATNLQATWYQASSGIRCLALTRSGFLDEPPDTWLFCIDRLLPWGIIITSKVAGPQFKTQAGFAELVSWAEAILSPPVFSLGLALAGFATLTGNPRAYAQGLATGGYRPAAAVAGPWGTLRASEVTYRPGLACWTQDKGAWSVPTLTVADTRTAAEVMDATNNNSDLTAAYKAAHAGADGKYHPPKLKDLSKTL